MIPWEYEDGQSISVRVDAGMLTAVADVSATVDIAVYESDEDSLTSGSDICATAAVSDNMNSLTFAEIDFIVTPTTLVAGELLDVLISVAVRDNGDADVVKGCIGSVQLLCDVR